MTRQPNGCSTPAPKSRAAQQWIERTCLNNEEEAVATNDEMQDKI